MTDDLTPPHWGSHEAGHKMTSEEIDALVERLETNGDVPCGVIVDAITTLRATRADLAQAAVAAAYEAAARTIDTLGDSAVTEALGTRLCCDGRMCGCQGADVGAYILHHIRALATPDQIAALATKVDASQAPNPAVNGGSCQSDTIPLPRAEVEALMEAAEITLAAIMRLQDDWGDYDPQGIHWSRITAFAATYAEGDEHDAVRMRKALTALRERMK